MADRVAEIGKQVGRLLKDDPDFGKQLPRTRSGRPYPIVYAFLDETIGALNDRLNAIGESPVTLLVPFENEISIVKVSRGSHDHNHQGGAIFPPTTVTVGTIIAYLKDVSGPVKVKVRQNSDEHLDLKLAVA